MNVGRTMAFLMAAVVLSGCNGGESSSPPAVSAQPPATAPPPPPIPTAQKEPQMVLKKAEKGVGAKGHYDTTGPASFVTVPVASLFAARERIAFEIQIPQAMSLFKAAEGRAPKSHEEFMERIIKEQHIALPTLPEGQRYLYDPRTEQLMVQQPATE